MNSVVNLLVVGFGTCVLGLIIGYQVGFARGERKAPPDPLADLRDLWKRASQARDDGNDDLAKALESVVVTELQRREASDAMHREMLEGRK